MLTSLSVSRVSHQEQWWRRRCLLPLRRGRPHGKYRTKSTLTAVSRVSQWGRWRRWRWELLQLWGAWPHCKSINDKALLTGSRATAPLEAAEVAAAALAMAVASTATS